MMSVGEGRSSAQGGIEMARLLFYSGSIGLGHVTRDVAIADEIRKLRPDTEIDWLASSPAREYLEQRGEHMHPQAARLGAGTASAEKIAKPNSLNVTMWALSARKQWSNDAAVALSLIESGHYNAVIGDESYDLAISLLDRPALPGCPCFILYDFLGLDRMTVNPLECMAVYLFNRTWSKDPRGHYRPVFLGELEDLTLHRFGLSGPPRREWARSYADVVGHALQFDPSSYADRRALKDRLGYGQEPLVLASVGGTAVGADLLRLCIAAYPYARRAVPDLRMVVVAGPRLSLPAGDLPDGVELRGFVPRLHEHLAACDIAVVQGGGTSTIELTALRRPFLFFPLEGHCEQQKYVVPRQKRLRAGVELRLRNTSPEELGRQITANVVREADYLQPNIAGAKTLARIVIQATA
jgi:UDP:flavonoid glycosyltransferase YjiC (YdhE family)